MGAIMLQGGAGSREGPLGTEGSGGERAEEEGARRGTRGYPLASGWLVPVKTGLRLP